MVNLLIFQLEVYEKDRPNLENTQLIIFDIWNSLYFNKRCCQEDRIWED